MDVILGRKNLHGKQRKTVYLHVRTPEVVLVLLCTGSGVRRGKTGKGQVWRGKDFDGVGAETKVASE